ncbi:hypothetical protein ACHAXN_008313 [Cyclotella atomus]
MVKSFLLLLSSAITHTHSLSTTSPTQKDRPLLRQFGAGINERVLNSKSGLNRCHHADSFQSSETIPCLDMQSSSSSSSHVSINIDMSSKHQIRKAYTASTINGQHGRSSGSGCCIIRLHGQDANSVRGLVDFADDFFAGVDDESRNSAINDLGVFRIGNNIHAGFDVDVNEEGKMQVLYTKLIPNDTEDSNPLLLPLEVGELVGINSMNKAQDGMGTLFDIGSQITSAVLGMNAASTNKLLDDCTDVVRKENRHDLVSENADKIADNVSNSYQRIIRYLEPQSKESAEEDAAFWPHVDSTFLTLIPMPDIGGLEVWCPSSKYGESENLEERGEWVRPTKPVGLDSNANDCLHVVALAGEFLQLLSNGQVPTCIHRVIAPQPPSPPAFGFAPKQYKPRVSAPLFLRPRRGEDATLDVESDLRKSGEGGLYFEKNLLHECDSMRVWDYMDCMSPNN